MLTLRVSRWPFFIYGMVCYAGANMFYQDWLGLDAYVAALKAGWLDTPLWFDALICVTAVAGMIIPFKALAQAIHPCVACTIMDRLHRHESVRPALEACTAEEHADIHNELKAIVWTAADLGILKS